MSGASWSVRSMSPSVLKKNHVCLLSILFVCVCVCVSGCFVPVAVAVAAARWLVMAGAAGGFVGSCSLSHSTFLALAAASDWAEPWGRCGSTRDSALLWRPHVTASTCT